MALLFRAPSFPSVERSSSFVLALISIAAVSAACHDVPVDAISPASPALRSTSQVEKGNKLAQLRAIGEGCAMIARDSIGVVRALPLSRDQLPFALPAIRRGESTNPGNGRIDREQRVSYAEA
jgi:hypothetical protein